MFNELDTCNNLKHGKGQNDIFATTKKCQGDTSHLIAILDYILRIR